MEFLLALIALLIVFSLLMRYGLRRRGVFPRKADLSETKTAAGMLGAIRPDGLPRNQSGPL